MAARTKWIAAGAVAAALALAATAPATAQQQGPPAIDVDKVVTAMELTGDARAEVAERLTQLNARLAERDGTAGICYETWETFSDLSVDLTPAQWRTLSASLWSAGVMGPMGHGRGMGGMMGHGAGWSGHMQGMSGSMRGMGANGRMGPGAHQGGMHHGTMWQGPRRGAN